MRSATYLSLLLTAWTAAAAPKASQNSLRTSVNTSSGVFAPYFSDSQLEVASFLDIPYAESPVGDLRFAPPLAKRYPGDKVIRATNLPAGCFQYVAPYLRGTVTDGPVTAAAFQRNDFSNTTEDCLRLSIFAPAKTTRNNSSSQSLAKGKSLPVIVWIHGGGYSFGGINVPFQLAPRWVQRSQKHIVVQVQYRLNLLGLPNAAGLAETEKNFDLPFLDQRVAIEWVRANIANFGGDPDRITLWGESAGAYSVDGYLFAWPHDPIVKGVIADSGNAVAIPSVLTDPNNHTTFSFVADRLGCGNLSAAAELKCMRQVPASKIKTYLQAGIGEGGAADDTIAFGAFADNVTIFSNYTERIGKNGSKFPIQIPLLIGTNTNEGAAVVPYNFTGTNTATELPSDLAKVAQGFALNLQCTTLEEVRLRSEAGATTYQYLYAGNFTNISPLPWLGAYHTAELPLIFGTHDIDGPSTDFEKRVSERMQDLYLQFAIDPENGLRSAGWPAATAQLNQSRLIEWAAGHKAEQVITAEALREECVRNGFAV
ncbi:Acylcarnitine hydrolase [Colletotrichum siamense]|uniref:Acylcarnitine hydrolase n=1 Tax=Colletotrichum siamense TaxID=690259 RepID=UPI0018727E8D|nr:Acylcarnitine hydrolase [Colletotrichum siamense]KAF5494471.1 Acylcarnitine hydrolase [Colletotrichum siamense]